MNSPSNSQIIKTITINMKENMNIDNHYNNNILNSRTNMKNKLMISNINLIKCFKRKLNSLKIIIIYRDSYKQHRVS